MNNRLLIAENIPKSIDTTKCAKMSFEDKAEVVISQLREDRDRLLDVLNKIMAEINTPNRGTCDYFIVDKIEEIISKYRKEQDNE